MASRREYEALYANGFVVFGAGVTPDKGPTKYINMVAKLNTPEFTTADLDHIEFVSEFSKLPELPELPETFRFSYFDYESVGRKHVTACYAQKVIRDKTFTTPLTFLSWYMQNAHVINVVCEDRHVNSKTKN